MRSFVRICVFVRPTAFRTTAFGNCRVTPWLVHAKVREPHLNPRFVWTFVAFPFRARVKGRKVHTNWGLVRCGSQTFAWTSHVSGWIVWRRTDFDWIALQKIRLVSLKSGVAPANQTKERAKTKSSWISPIFVNSGVCPWENKNDSRWTFVPECPREKFVNWPFWFGLPGPLLMKTQDFFSSELDQIEIGVQPEFNCW